MKRLFLLSTTLLLAFSLMAQQRTDTLPGISTRAYYLKLSKQQKSGATALVIGGGALAVAGGFIWFISPVAGLSETGDVKGLKRTGQTMTFVGAGLAAISIPLFRASNKNKEKAALYIGSTGLQYAIPQTSNLLCIGTKINL